jgi:hypothetical protein
MEIVTKELRQKLLENGRAQAASRSGHIDFKPVVRIFDPCSTAVWLLTEITPNNPDVAFGLCDFGFGCPELGRVSLAELEAFRGRFGLRLERDMYWEAAMTLSEYHELAL